jgi:hypothetical protein
MMKKSSQVEFIKIDNKMNKMMSIRERHENTKEKLNKLILNDNSNGTPINPNIIQSYDVYGLDK